MAVALPIGLADELVVLDTGSVDDTLDVVRAHPGTIVHESTQYFLPQMETKIMNEGWASYWHETLFLKDELIK